MLACRRAFAIFALLLAVPFTSQADDEIETAASLLELLVDVDAEAARQTLTSLATKAQTGEFSAEQAAALQQRLLPLLDKLIGEPAHPLAHDAALLAATWKHSAALTTVRKLVASADNPPSQRLAGLTALLAADDEQALDRAAALLAEDKSPLDFRSGVLAALGRSDAERVADLVLGGYAKYEPELQPKAIELLTQRTAWSKLLLAAIGRGEIPATALNANQVARLQSSADQELRDLVQAKWGTIRTERNPQREQVVAEMRTFLAKHAGDAHRGAVVFQKVCGQCHKIHGEGHDVGPEITANGRASFEQLLSNVFDPSLVIGAAYRAQQLATDDGRVLTGLVMEENEQRVVLKMQGGKIETIPRDEIEEMRVSPLSLMPEGLENQLKPAELADLFAFLVLDRPPGDATAQPIPGAPTARAK
jgi:putative heme-binding domain-containing protein